MFEPGARPSKRGWLLLVWAWLAATACAEDFFAPPLGTRYAAVAAGGGHTCALDTEGRAWCWGSNSHGQLGVARGHRSAWSPVAVNGATRFRDLVAGDRHTCAIDLTGHPWCWGGNGAGQLGDGTFDHRDAPRPVLFGGAVSRIAAGASESCATDEVGGVWCWGRDAFASTRNLPVRVPDVPMASGVAVGAGHVCAAGPGGAFCWGANQAFQLGGATVTSSPLPVRVSGSAFLHHVTAGRTHACALTDRQEVLCWGENAGGQLGLPDGSPAGTPVAVRVSGPRILLDASASGDLTCAASPVDVSCWGLVDDPEFGIVRTLPTPVRGLDDDPVEDLAVGGRHACLVQDGVVRCWGRGESGQLGDGRGLGSGTPVGP